MRVLAEAQDILLDLPLRGDRDYLHSTTIFDAALQLFKNPSNIVLTIRGQIRRRLTLSATPGERQTLGEFTCTSDGTERTFFLCEDPKSAPTNRTSDNEPEILASARREHAGLSAIVGQPGTMIETLVALQKHLIEQTARPPGKVWFSRVELTHPIFEGRAKIDGLRTLGGRLFQSRVSDNSGTLGTIVFLTART